MNRSAYCIQMLQLLKSRGFLTRDQIATQLQINKRNVAEFRKELEMAGYVIESTTGKFGGYRLLSDSILPSVALRSEESLALRQLMQYISSHHDFLMEKEAVNALSKIISTTHIQEDIQDTYLENEQYILTSYMRHMIQTMQQAKQMYQVVEIQYRSLKDKEANWICIHPYELINYKGAYYCFAYSLKAKDFRNFKFSEERLKDLRLKDAFFTRDLDFDIKKYIGISGLIKGEIYNIEVLLYDETARSVAEKRIGIQPELTWLDERSAILKTMFEGKLEAKKFILSLGKQGILLAPSDLLVEIHQEVKELCKLYEENEVVQ